MNRKTILAALTGLLFVALTLSITPASAGVDNNCDANTNTATYDARGGPRCCPQQVPTFRGGDKHCRPPCDLENAPAAAEARGGGRHCQPPCDVDYEPVRAEARGGGRHCQPPCDDDNEVILGANDVRRGHKDDPCEPDPCEAFDLFADAFEGGSILLTFNLPDGARGVRVLRDNVLLDTLPQPQDSYLDETAVIGETYVYTVEVHYPNGEGKPRFTCDVEVTSVPVFGNFVASGLAVGLGALAYVGVRRRM